MKSIGAALTRLASQVLEEAASSRDPKFRLDSFKALTAFHIGTMRAAKGLPEDPQEGSIVSLKERIAASQQAGFKKDTWVKRQTAGDTNDLDRIARGE